MKRLIATLALAATPALAQDVHPVIREIGFIGNRITQPKVMLREMALAAGSPADPARIERSRQAILDLGLFNSVSIEQTPLADGVRLNVTVEEKWYILPIPRYSVNSDGKDQYGMSLRWYNVAGLNHTLSGSWANSDDKKSNKGRRTQYDLGYSAPFLFDRPYQVSLGLGQSQTPILASPANYQETFDTAFIGVSRTFPVAAASQGWSLGGSVNWSRQDTEGSGAPAPYGAATALGLSAGFRDLRFRVYSEEGLVYGASVASAVEGLASDYSFNVLRAHYSRRLAVGARPHQSVNLYINAASYHGGPQGAESDAGVFNLGGASSLRGYGSDAFVGDAYYYLGAEYLRPVGWDWLRLVAIAEAGNTFADVHDAHLKGIKASVGFGLRLRLITFVSVEVEMGLAWPLTGGGSRFFASRV